MGDRYMLIGRHSITWGEGRGPRFDEPEEPMPKTKSRDTKYDLNRPGGKPLGDPCVTPGIITWFTPEDAVVKDVELWRRCLTATGHVETATDPTTGETSTYEAHDAELAASLFSFHRWRLEQKEP